MEALMKRRQAIYAGLAPLLREEETMAALEIFDTSFAEVSAFNLQSYVDRLYAQFKPECARRDLHRALVQSVFLGGRNENATSTEGHGDTSHVNTLFAFMLGGFLDRVAGHDPQAETAVRTYLMEKSSALGLPVGTQVAIEQWLFRRRANIDVPLSREGMRHLLNLAYVLVCEYLGPVIADRFLSEAVKESENLPEAREVAPRSLL